MFLLNENNTSIELILTTGDTVRLQSHVITDIGNMTPAIPLPARVREIVNPNATPVLPTGPAYPTFPFLGMTISGVSGVGVTEYWDGTAWVVVSTGTGGGSTTWVAYNAANAVVAGDNLMVDTSLAAVTITLPTAPASSSPISFMDTKGTWGTNAVTLSAGANTIMGIAAPLTLTIPNKTVQLLYVGTDWRIL